MSYPLHIIHPKQPPVLRCSSDRLTLRDGEASLIQNARTDSNVLMTRVADSVINASPPTGARTSGGNYFPRGDFQGFVQGTAYWLSAWDMTAGGTAIFSQNLSTGAYTEVTNAGGSPATTFGGTTSGNTRFPTQGNVTFTQVTTPRRTLAGATVSPVDQIQIQNGLDQPIMWNPGGIYSTVAQVMWATPINPIANSNVFNPISTWSGFWQVMGNTKTYYSSAGPPRINQTNFQMIDSTVTYGASDATKRVPRLNLGTSTNSGDIATVQFPSGSNNFYGPYLYILWEASQATIQTILKDSAIEVNKDAVGYASISSGWNTLYDPSDTDPFIKKMPDLISIDAGNTRSILKVPLRAITTTTGSARTLYHLRFRRVNNNDVGTTQTALIIAIGSTGLGGGFPFGIEWSFVYADHFASVETPPVPQGATVMDQLANVGGPFAPDALPNNPILLPQSTLIFYDWHLPVANSVVTAFTGGLNGAPSHVDFYFRIPGEQTQAFYFSSGEMWYPDDSVVGTGWHNAAGSLATATYKTEITGASHALGIGYGDFTNIDFASQDPGVPAPSDFHQPMPKAAVNFSAGNRLFCGRIKTAGGSLEKGRLMFSDKGFFNRFRSEPELGNPDTGSFVVFEGEQVQAGKVGSAVAQGSVSISVWTDRSYYRLGQSGGETLIGSGFDGNQLSFAYRVSADGTNMPYAVAQWNNSFFWVNVDGHVMQDIGGSLANISLGRVTNSQGLTSGGILDIIADVPSARRGNAVAVFARQRLYLFLTPASGTTNTRVAIYDYLRQDWESLDTTTSCEWAAVVYDSSQNGAGQRVLLHGLDGQSRGYEEGSGNVSFRIVGRGFLGQEIGGLPDGATINIKQIELFMDTDAGHTLVASWYRNFDSSAVDFTMTLDSQAGNLQWLLQGSLTAGQTQTEAWGGYMDVAGTIAGGKKIRSLVAYIEPELNDGRGYTA